MDRRHNAWRRSEWERVVGMGAVHTQRELRRLRCEEVRVETDPREQETARLCVALLLPNRVLLGAMLER